MHKYKKSETFKQITNFFKKATVYFFSTLNYLSTDYKCFHTSVNLFF